MNRWSLAAPLFAGALLCAAPAVWASPAHKAPAKKAPSAGQALSNAGLTAKVKSALLADKVAPGLSINVDSSNGVVTLSGELDTAAQKARSVQVTRKVKGVKKVVDHLTVKAHATAPGSPPKTPK
jgi:hyperosmotically inducible protein